MNSLKKKITIEYYRYELTNTKTNISSNYNLDNLFSNMESKKLEDRIYELNSSKIRIEKIKKSNSYWLINILKFRETDIAKTAKINEEAEDLQLDEDEYLSEDMTVIYNIQEKKFAIQRNRFCCSPTQLERYFQQILIHELKCSELAFKFIPIMRNNLERTLKNIVNCRKITCKISDWPNTQEFFNNKSLLQIAQIGEDFEATNIEITISVGRNRNKILSSKKVTELIQSLFHHSQNDITLQKATASLQTADDENAENTRFETFDLLSNKLQDVICLSIETRESISFSTISSEMIKKFNNHISQAQFE